MRIVMFYHSLVSDWNHGNAHFLRGIVSELQARNHEVILYEPIDGWSRENLLAHYGDEAIRDFHQAYPHLHSRLYRLDSLDLDLALDGADLVMVHEWNDPSLVERIGRHRLRRRPYALLFHDTHHRSATAPEEMACYDLSKYDGVLAFGSVVREIYLARRWARQAWTWHEAADHRYYRPMNHRRKLGDVIWIGNWGDDERAEELRQFIIDPVRVLGLKAKIHGVRYPEEARRALHDAGIEYGEWLPASQVPEAYSRYRLTVHVPRRPYVESLPGIPTIRVFEALACGIPLICSPWTDAESLFRPGEDFLIARHGEEMRQLMREILRDDTLAQRLATRGRETVMRQHTCAHRVDELMQICEALGVDTSDERERSLLRAAKGVALHA